jgi:polar amino acid transport system substrate-binding protein
MRSLVFTIAIIALGAGALTHTGFAADATCEPSALATKSPSLVGKTIKVAQDGEGPPYTFRDPENFDHIVALAT